MTQAIPKPITFEQFIDWYPEDSETRYELHDGFVVEMPKPRGSHSRIAGFITAELSFEIRRSQLPYFIPKECVIKATDSKSGYEPDVVVLNERATETEPLWEKASTVTRGESVRLVVEVISTNWRDDYGRKVVDYEALGIPEVWLVDYNALGAARYIGSPKQPTLSVYRLVEGEYQVTLLRQADRLISHEFPELAMTVDRILVGQ